MPDINAFNKIIQGNFTQASKLQWLSHYTGQPAEAIQKLLDLKGKKGFKILGKRFGSNIDSLAGYLHEVAKEHQFKKPGRMKKRVRSPKDITPFKKQTNIKIHPNTIKTLHHLANVHEIPTKVIDNALKAGAPLKTLLKMLNSETIPSQRIHEHLVSKTQEKLAVKGAANTIKPRAHVPDPDKIKRLQSELKENTKLLNKEANKIRIIDRQNYAFKTLEAGANEFPNQSMTGSSKAAFKGNKWFTSNNLANTARLAIGTLKTIKNLSVGYAMHAASDAFVAPHARRAGEQLGEKVLVPLGRKIDDSLPGINSEDERQRISESLMIKGRNQKKKNGSLTIKSRK